MGINVTINEEVPEEYKYPCLKISSLGTVVLFTAPKIGVSVAESKIHGHVGTYLEEWREENFKPFHGSVTLVNK